MPDKIQIEIIKHNDADFRVIFKDCSDVERLRFVTASEALDFVSSNLKAGKFFLRNS